jgi:hypothetical protein
MICDVGIMSSMKLFWDLCSIARIKYACVADHLEISSGFHQWNVNLLERLMIGRQMSLLCFLIFCIFLDRGVSGEYKLCWPLQEKFV